MRPARVAAIALVVVLGLALALLGAAWALVRTDWAARQLALRAADLLGQPVGLAGARLGLVPRVRLELRGISLGPGSDPLLSAERVTLDFAWSELAGAPAVVRRVELDAPVLRLAVDAAGGDNWSGLLDRLAELAGEGPAAFSVADLAVERGRLDYADARTGRQLALSGLAARATRIAPRTPSPLELRFAGESGDHVFHAGLAGSLTLDPDGGRYALDDGALRGWVGGGRFGTGGAELAGRITRAELDLAADRARLEATDLDALGVPARARLVAEGLAGSLRLTFALEAGPFAPRAPANALQWPLPATADPAALGEAELRVAGTADASGLSVDRLEGRVDDTRFEGSLRWPQDGPAPRLRLSADQLDLDRYLPPAAPAGGTTPAAVLAALFEPLSALDLDAVVEIEEARAAGAVARGLRIVLAPEPARP